VSARKCYLKFVEAIQAILFDMIEEDLHVSIGKEIRIMENVHQIGEQEGVEYVSKSGHNSSSLQIYLK
jgi:hypothetical protein